MQIVGSLQKIYLRVGSNKGNAIRRRDLCNHAGFCLRASGIGNLTRSSDDPEAKRLAIEEAGNCTSGRLVAWRKELNKSIEPEFAPSIALVEEPHKGCSGPIWVRGSVPVESSDGAAYEVRNRVALCRCGASSNKPFCDGRHMAIRFTDGDTSLENRWGLRGDFSANYAGCERRRGGAKLNLLCHQQH